VHPAKQPTPPSHSETTRLMDRTEISFCDNNRFTIEMILGEDSGLQLLIVRQGWDGRPPVLVGGLLNSY